LRFWDLVQPFFMFIVGAAMPFAFAKREERGDSRGKMTGHALRRSLILLFLGWALYCIGPGKITFELWNVLAQLSFTYLVAFFMMQKSGKIQILFTFGLLVLTEMLYRFWPVEGFNQPFVPDHNFGSYVDLLLMGKLSHGHWVAFNAVPTTVHTMWGVLAGQVLRSQRSESLKVTIVLCAGLTGVVLGIILNLVTPIIKRICTSSFVIMSGGWCLIVLAFVYWLVDIKKVRKIPAFFAVVGMNPLFIYLFAETGGTEWLSGIVGPFTSGIFGWIGVLPSQIITALLLWFSLWSICYFLYRRRIFIKI
jgi:predicted acyltransferase